MAEFAFDHLKFATDQLAIAQRSLKRDGAYLALPADWAGQMPSFQVIAQSIASEFGIPAPTYQSSGESWLSVNEFVAMQGISTARTDKFGQPLQAGQLVAMAKELSNPNASVPVQVNIAGPALTAANITDNKTGQLVSQNMPVTYTLTFSEDINASIALPESSHIIAESIVPFQPVVGESSELISARTNVPRLGNQRASGQHRVMGDSL